MTIDDHDPASAEPGLIDIDLLPVPVIELSTDAQALRANAAFVRLTGIDRERIEGIGWYACLSPDRRLPLFAALAARTDFELELRLLRADGVKAWIRASARWVSARQTFVCALCDGTDAELRMQRAQAEVDRFSLLADAVPAMIAYYQRSDLTCIYANRHYARTFGLDPQRIVGLTFAQVIGDDAARQIQPQVDIVLAQRRTASYVRELADASGAQRWLEVSLIPHQVGGGPVIGCFVLIVDITTHRRAELAARESQERLAAFMGATMEGIAFHQDGIITDVNAPMAAMLGLAPERMLGRHVREFVDPNHLSQAMQVFSEGLEATYESALLHRDGSSVAVEITPRTTHRDGRTLRLVVVRDVRDRHAAQARIRQLVQHDELTGLLNRAAFVQALGDLLSDRRDRVGALAVLAIDLDHFKRVNDVYGQDAGDALLRALASRLRRLLPAGALAGRLGGDEFVVALPDAVVPGRVRELAVALRDAMSTPVAHAGRSLSITPTLGVAMYPEHGVDTDDLLRHAGEAVRAGKLAGRDHIAVFESDMTGTQEADLAIEEQLSRALVRGEFELIWQPRVAVADGRLQAMQALVRWNHPQHGRLAPHEFAGAAERRHLLQPLAAWALREAMRQQRRWSIDGLCEGPVALDLGALHPHGVALAATVAHAVADEPGPPGALLLELDQRILRGGGDATRVWLERLRALGAQVGIDDFGADGVSMSALRRMPLASVKIQHGLVGALPHEAGAGAVVRAIVVLAHGLGLTVCAAGVETGEQRQWLLEAGCDQFQGAWLCPPLAAADAAEWLRKRA